MAKLGWSIEILSDSKMLELRLGSCCWMFYAILYNNCKTCRWYINIAMEKCGRTLSPDFAFHGKERNYSLNLSFNVLSFAFNNTGSSQIMRFITLYLWLSESWSMLVYSNAINAFLWRFASVYQETLPLCIVHRLGEFPLPQYTLIYHLMKMWQQGFI